MSPDHPGTSGLEQAQSPPPPPGIRLQARGAWFSRLTLRTRWLLAAAIGALVLAVLGAYFAMQVLRARHHWDRAQQALAEHDFTRAQVHLQAFLELQPNSGEAHFLLARACRRAAVEDFDNARAHIG